MGHESISEMRRVFEFKTSDQEGRDVVAKMTLSHNMYEYEPWFYVEHNGVTKTFGSYTFGMWADCRFIGDFEEMFGDAIVRVVERMERAGETFRRKDEDSFDGMTDLFACRAD